MKLTSLALATVAWASVGARAERPEPITVKEPPRVEFQQNLGARVPIEKLRFKDEHGRDVYLKDFFNNGKPVVLVLAYYECPNLCTLVMNGLLKAMRETKWTVGHEYEVVTVSINPIEGPGLAFEKRKNYIANYGRPGVEKGWHFLTGQDDQIRELAKIVGFEYIYDENIRQYAHPSGIAFLSPNGTISSYLLGIEFPARNFKLALSEAGGNKIGSLADKLLLLCYHYDATAGTYTPAIKRILSAACGVTFLALAGSIALMLRQDKRERKQA